ncbi:hypothetical protein T439DRAFT_126580 [Meredithblackwellia eburnea MCA 4105]
MSFGIRTSESQHSSLGVTSNNTNNNNNDEQEQLAPQSQSSTPSILDRGRPPSRSRDSNSSDFYSTTTKPLPQHDNDTNNYNSRQRSRSDSLNSQASGSILNRGRPSRPSSFFGVEDHPPPPDNSNIPPWANNNSHSNQGSDYDDDDDQDDDGQRQRRSRAGSFFGQLDSNIHSPISSSTSNYDFRSSPFLNQDKNHQAQQQLPQQHHNSASQTNNSNSSSQHNPPPPTEERAFSAHQRNSSFYGLETTSFHHNPQPPPLPTQNSVDDNNNSCPSSQPASGPHSVRDRHQNLVNGGDSGSGSFSSHSHSQDNASISNNNSNRQLPSIPNQSQSFQQQPKYQVQHAPYAASRAASLYGIPVASSAESTYNQHLPPVTSAPLLDHSHLQPGALASLLSHDKTLELYRANAKKTNDPDVQFEFCTFVMEVVSDMEDARASAAPNTTNAQQEQVEKQKQQALVSESVALLSKLAHRGHVKSQYFLADCYTQGIGTAKPGKRDYDKAFPLFVLAGKHGHADACFRAAQCCENGWGCKRDHSKAVNLYRRAAILSHPGAMHRLGLAEINGELSLTKRPREGVKWLKRAAELADSVDPPQPQSLHELALLSEKGIDNVIFKDEEYAAELLARASELQYPPSAYKLGECYEYGKMGCPQDSALSIHYYNIAAQQSHREACFALTAWYLVGSPGVLPQSDTEAYLWARKAADMGLAKAEYAVGYFTEVGIGTHKDAREALSWFEKAAKQGDKRAKERLRLAAATGGSTTASSKKAFSRDPLPAPPPPGKRDEEDPGSSMAGRYKPPPPSKVGSNKQKKKQQTMPLPPTRPKSVDRRPGMGERSMSANSSSANSGSAAGAGVGDRLSHVPYGFASGGGVPFSHQASSMGMAGRPPPPATSYDPNDPYAAFNEGSAYPYRPDVVRPRQRSFSQPSPVDFSIAGPPSHLLPPPPGMQQQHSQNYNPVAYGETHEAPYGQFGSEGSGAISHHRGQLSQDEVPQQRRDFRGGGGPASPPPLTINTNFAQQQQQQQQQGGGGGGDPNGRFRPIQPGQARMPARQQLTASPVLEPQGRAEREAHREKVLQKRQAGTGRSQDDKDCQIM